MEYVCSVLHEPHICWAGVLALTVGDRMDKLILEFLLRSKQIWFDETDHGMVWSNKQHYVSSNIVIGGVRLAYTQRGCSALVCQ